MEQRGRKVTLGNYQSSRKKRILAFSGFEKGNAVVKTNPQTRMDDLEASSRSVPVEEMSEPRQPSLF